MTNPSKTKNIRTRGGFILGGTIVCSLAMTSAFGQAAMASEVDNPTASDTSVVEVVDLRVSETPVVDSAQPVVVVDPPAQVDVAPQPVVAVDPPAQVVQVETPTAPPAPSAPADTTAPTVTIKTGASESVQSNNQYGVISFKLYDAGKVDKVELNGVVKDLSNNVWSDLNGVKPGVFGAVNGKNVLKVYDVAGNVSTIEFTLDATGPTATVKVESTVGTDGLYQKVSYKLHDPANVVKAILNGVEKPLTPNVWSDLNDIKPGTFGAVEGLNTLILVDALGNQSTLTFTLDTLKPVINIQPIGQWVGGVHTFPISQTEANPDKAYIEINERVNGKWVKRDGGWLFNTNDLTSAFDTTKLANGAEAQIKVSSWDKLGLHSSSTYQFKVDNVAPTLTVKPESIGSDGVYSKFSAKLFDGLSGVDKISVNGVMKDLTNNTWSDLNNLKPGQNGAVEGENTIVLYDVAGNTTTLVITLDSIAPTATNFAQVYQAKEGGRVSVTLTFDEAVSGLGQGWYGSGTTWTKAYYSSKQHTVTFKDAAGNVGTYTFTVDATAPVVVNELQEWQKDKNRNLTTLTFDEPTTVSSQGWYAVAGSDSKIWTKAIFNGKEYKVEFTDAVGNPGTYTFKAKTQSEIEPVVVTPTEPEGPVNPPVIGEPQSPETPVVTEPSTVNPAPAVNPVKAAVLALTGSNNPLAVVLGAALAIFVGLGAKLKSVFGR